MTRHIQVLQSTFPSLLLGFDGHASLALKYRFRYAESGASPPQTRQMAACRPNAIAHHSSRPPVPDYGTTRPVLAVESTEGAERRQKSGKRWKFPSFASFDGFLVPYMPGEVLPWRSKSTAQKCNSIRPWLAWLCRAAMRGQKRPKLVPLSATKI